MVVLLQLHAAMTQSRFRGQIDLISLQYKNVGSGDPHSKSPCHHPYTSITTSQPLLLIWLQISHKNKVDITRPESKIAEVPLPTTKPRKQQRDALVSRDNLVFASTSCAPALWLCVSHGVAFSKGTD